MKILLVHNHYQNRGGGEDAVFESEAAVLEKSGHEVIRYTASNDDVRETPALVAACRAIWNSRTYSELRQLTRTKRPDIVHFHNTYAVISPAAYYAARSEGVPVVQTIHNYRLFCPAATFSRKGRICEDCVGRSFPWRAVRHACYRESRATSLAVAAMLTAHRIARTWARQVDLFIAPTDFTRNKIVQGGLPDSKVVTKPHFLLSDPGERSGDGRYFLFLGRYATEKGVRVLLDAWRGLKDAPLVFAGDGPLRSMLAEEIETTGGNVELRGWVALEEAMRLLKGAIALIVPSLWYETFSLNLIEAFACGVPVMTSRLGALAEVNREGETGLCFETGSAEDIREKARWALAHRGEMAEMGKRAREKYRSCYTSESHYRRIMEIYGRVLKRNSGRADCS